MKIDILFFIRNFTSIKIGDESNKNPFKLVASLYVIVYYIHIQWSYILIINFKSKLNNLKE